LLDGNASLLTDAVAGLLLAIWLWLLRRDLDVEATQVHDLLYHLRGAGPGPAGEMPNQPNW
jgi:hypothetical protein